MTVILCVCLEHSVCSAVHGRLHGSGHACPRASGEGKRGVPHKTSALRVRKGNNYQ